MQLLRSLCLPGLLYAVEVLPLTKFEISMLNRLADISDGLLQDMYLASRILRDTSGSSWSLAVKSLVLGLTASDDDDVSMLWQLLYQLIGH